MPHVLYRNGEVTPRTALVLPSPATYPLIFELALLAGESFSWRGRPQTVRGLEEAIWIDTYEHAVIVERAREMVLGYVAFTSLNLIHGTTYISVYLHPRAQATGVPFEAVTLLLDRLFRYTDVRKVYMESTSETSSRYSSPDFVVEEGRLVDHRRVKGGFTDLVISAIKREPFLENIGPLVAGWETVNALTGPAQNDHAPSSRSYDPETNWYPPVTVED